MQERALYSPLCMNDWYAVHCKVGKEYCVNAILRSQFGMNTYLPESRVTHGKGNRLRPFFPGYLFIQTNFEKFGINDINFCTGVKHIVSYDGKPQPIPHPIIDEIRERLERLNSSGGIYSYKFQPGEQVRVKDGPLEGLEAVFMSTAKPSERATILLVFFGHLRKVQIEANTLESAQRFPKELKKRYTRGNGRKIAAPGPHVQASCLQGAQSSCNVGTPFQRDK